MRNAARLKPSLSFVLLLVAIVAGTVVDRPRPRPPMTIAGYRVLSVDFHTHSSMWGDGAFTPWGLVLEAERRGLDAIAITGHNETFDSRLGHWFSRRAGGPIVLRGEEVLGTPRFHIIAVGISTTVGFMQSAAAVIEDIHHQGGIAIAAHPVAAVRSGYDNAAMQRLDAAEICHPLIYSRGDAQSELEAFAARAPLAAIGSSDFHGLGQMGLCRTYVFAREATEAGILDAVRARRTVVFDGNGRAYGDNTLIPLARQAGLESEAARLADAGWLARASGFAGVIGLAACLTLGVLSRRGNER